MESKMEARIPEGITLVDGPEHSYSAARMGLHVLGGPRGPYGSLLEPG